MLDKNLLDEIEKRMHQVRDEGRELTICEKDREYLYLNLVEVINGSILDLLVVPNMVPIED
jgi:hypothetical protein